MMMMMMINNNKDIRVVRKGLNKFRNGLQLKTNFL